MVNEQFNADELSHVNSGMTQVWRFGHRYREIQRNASLFGDLLLR